MYLFQVMMLELISYCFFSIDTNLWFIPLRLGSNAQVERLFSLGNQTWTNDKSRLTLEKLKAILMIKHNIQMDCLQFYNFIRTQKLLLR